MKCRPHLKFFTHFWRWRIGRKKGKKFSRNLTEWGEKGQEKANKEAK